MNNKVYHTVHTSRKYQGTWEQLKRVETLIIELDNFRLLTDKQIEKQLKTLRKAISKEKWLDEGYTRGNPFSKITSEFRVEQGKIVFHLNSNIKDLSYMFT